MKSSSLKRRKVLAEVVGYGCVVLGVLPPCDLGLGLRAGIPWPWLVSSICPLSLQPTEEAAGLGPLVFPHVERIQSPGVDRFAESALPPCLGSVSLNIRSAPNQEERVLMRK